MENKMIWMDLEMTGLNAEEHVIIEIATIVTDNKLDILAEGPNIAINYPEEVLNNIEEWSRIHHEKSGLMERVRVSKHDCRGAELETIRFLKTHCVKGKSPLCGNSVWQDRRFLIKYMPDLEEFLHYRNIDVSSIKELAKRWFPDLPHFEKAKSHLASSDIKDSINELKYYRQKIFQKQY